MSIGKRDQPRPFGAKSRSYFVIHDVSIVWKQPQHPRRPPTALQQLYNSSSTSTSTTTTKNCSHGSTTTSSGSEDSTRLTRLLLDVIDASPTPRASSNSSSPSKLHPQLRQLTTASTTRQFGLDDAYHPNSRPHTLHDRHRASASPPAARRRSLANLQLYIPIYSFFNN